MKTNGDTTQTNLQIPVVGIRIHQGWSDAVLWIENSKIQIKSRFWRLVLPFHNSSGNWNVCESVRQSAAAIRQELPFPSVILFPRNDP